MAISGPNYHRQTSYERGTLGGRGLDWSNQPDLFKSYPDLETVVLPQPQKPLEKDLLTMLKAPWPSALAKPMDHRQLSRILTQAYTLTARTRTAGGMFYYRSVASAGALYPTELYIAVNEVSHLNPGLYHYRIKDSALAALRTENPAAAIKDILIGTRPPGSISLAFLVTAIFFRSAWKYADRAYRYVLLDAGHLAANLLASLKAARIKAQISYAFDDDKTAHLLGLSPHKEVCLAVITVDSASTAPPDTAPEPAALPSTFSDRSQVSPEEPSQDLIHQIHRAGRNAPLPDELNMHMGDILKPLSPKWGQTAPTFAKTDTLAYPNCVWSRRSKRNFVNTPIPREAFSYLMQLVHAFYQTDPALHGRAAATMATGVLINHVDQWTQGFYAYDAAQNRLGAIQESPLAGPMTDACLNQAWLANAALYFMFLADLKILDSQWGPRGYRYLMLNAGRLGQELYLGATALGLGCCGIGAIYDREAAYTLALPKDTALCYLVAVGAVKRL